VHVNLGLDVDTPYEMSTGILFVDSMQSICTTLRLCLTMLETSRWITRYGVGESSKTRLKVELCVRRLCCCADSVTRVRTRATRATVWPAPDFFPPPELQHPDLHPPSVNLPARRRRRPTPSSSFLFCFRLLSHTDTRHSFRTSTHTPFNHTTN